MNSISYILDDSKTLHSKGCDETCPLLQNIIFMSNTPPAYSMLSKLINIYSVQDVTPYYSQDQNSNSLRAISKAKTNMNRNKINKAIDKLKTTRNPQSTSQKQQTQTKHKSN